MEKRELFKIEGDKIVRLRRSCPRCGSGVFLADHKDRLSCGGCGYTEFKAKKDQTPQTQPVEKKPQKPVDKPHPAAEAAKPKQPEKQQPST